jgi:hypothetical protein
LADTIGAPRIEAARGAVQLVEFCQQSAGHQTAASQGKRSFDGEGGA